MSSRDCPYCGGETAIVSGEVIYPHRPDLYCKSFRACLPCKAWAGCHPGTERRMGRIANAETRKLKQAAHAAFDQLWQSGRMKRKAAYAWLQSVTGLTPNEAHIGWMEDDQLRAIPKLVADLASPDPRQEAES